MPYHALTVGDEQLLGTCIYIAGSPLSKSTSTESPTLAPFTSGLACDDTLVVEHITLGGAVCRDEAIAFLHGHDLSLVASHVDSAKVFLYLLSGRLASRCTVVADLKAVAAVNSAT